MSDWLKGYVTGVLVYMVLLLIAMQMCTPAKADQVDSRPYYQALIRHEATLQGVEPEIALAVAEVESHFNPKALGRHGEQGIFQLHPKFHKDFSISAGIKTLMYWRNQCPNKKEHTWVTCFNRGVVPYSYPKQTPYYKKVITAYQKYKRISVGSVAAN